MDNFREVYLPEVKGSLYLYAMPGRFEPYKSFEELTKIYGIDRVVCLTPTEEMKTLSPEYYKAVNKGSTPYQWEQFTIENYRSPEDWQSYAEFIRTLASGINDGEKILIHCAAGIGRTGMTATSILVMLGIDPKEAAQRVQEQGASPQRAVQQNVINWIKP